MVVYRRIRRHRQIPLRTLAPSRFGFVGAASGFLSAVLGTAGPFAAPFFLAAGLVKGAYIGSEAMTAAIMHITKLGIYGGISLLTPSGIAIGLLFGVFVIAGSYLGKRLLDQMPEPLFVALVEILLIVASLRFLLADLW